MVIYDISDTWNQEYDTAWREIEKVAKVLCEMRTENMGRGGINVAVFDAWVHRVYKRSNLFVSIKRQKEGVL